MVMYQEKKKYVDIIAVAALRCFVRIDLCYEPLPTLTHSIIPSGVSRRQFSFLATHSS